MEKQVEYMSVPDFADLAGVTKAGVYNRIKSGGLDEYIKLDGGVKMVSVDAVELFTPRKQGKVDKVDSVNSVNLSILSLEVEKEKEKAERLETTIQTLQGQLDILNSQLQAKDVQIANRDKNIEALNESIKAITALADQSQRLNAAEKVVNMKTIAEDTEKDTKKWWQFWK